MNRKHQLFHVWLIVLLGLAISAQTLAESKTKVSTPVPEISALSPESGSAGIKITINGTNFGQKKNKAAVLFATTQASIQLWSGSKIVAQAPKGSGEVKVKVVNSQGTASDGKSFTYSSTASGGGQGGNPGGGGSTGATNGLTNFKVLANNDLGMHCVDKDFSVFSILPPYNVVNAQVVGQNASTGKPVLLDGQSVVLRYSPIADASGSINSTSRSKSNFWQYAAALYGANLDPKGQGLKGLYMPADAPSPAQTQFGWNAGLGLFSAEGIPALPIDDAGQTNRYPLLRVTAFDKTSGQELGHTDTVVPVSEETTCSNCHATGKMAASGDGWSADPNLEIQTRTNVLILHDQRKATDLQRSQPVLCASCHYSPALDLAGNGPVGAQLGKPTMSAVMHDFHAQFKQLDGKPLFDVPAPVAGLDPTLKGIPPADQQTCYQCHPGKDTKCLRGAMTETVTCQNCHGDMKAVGGKLPLKPYGTINARVDDLNRHPWGDEPRCQSCHTGDSLNHVDPAIAGIDNSLAVDGLRLVLAYDRKDLAASPLLADNKRFAENDGKLFRHSKGHGGLACESCHGSTHAIWPGDAAHPNDNVAATQLQGHMGVVAECSSCHKAGSLPLTLNGPHGMHNIGDPRWASEDGHPQFYRQNPASCQTCHGKDLKGTALSRVAVDRTYSTEWGVKTRKKGESVSCWTCHDGPDGG
ncbi:MAG: IPT/TIG domain-containing protein [Methylococcaceae bacterium]|nr:IPT/TIG domain-containing protein [Methylococcaceae bacterium]